MIPFTHKVSSTIDMEMFVIECFGGFTTESLQSAHLVQMFNSTAS